MNVFYTNDCPNLAALDHCRIHRNKMIVEYAQLLSTAHHELGIGASELLEQHNILHIPVNRNMKVGEAFREAINKPELERIFSEVRE